MFSSAEIDPHQLRMETKDARSHRDPRVLEKLCRSLPRHSF